MRKVAVNQPGLLLQRDMQPELLYEKITNDSFICNPVVSGTVYGTLLNYKGELDSLGNAMHASPYIQPPKAPILYIKPANTLSGCNMPIPLPKGTAELQIGAALAVILGKTAKDVAEDSVFEYIAGYTVANDVTIPHSNFFRPAIKEKCRDGFCPIGPWIVGAEAVPSPDRLSITVFINGQLRQKNSTANLLRPVSKLVSEVSRFMTLYEGDALLVGIPENPPSAKDGDTVRIEIEQVGVLQNTILSETAMVLKGML
ncbi:fumarylacetoacetate hydrolase family protein [Peribacillus sp. SCS-155]|uniref:fumarylacetoacetate hydrolase family protein n=1 Tax=Peribacillus sedimenti TaxID=3115297 RepID=UPI003906A590